MTDYLDRRTDFDDPAIASAIDELSFWSARFGSLLFEHLELRADLTILDLACGGGFPLFELAQVHGSSCHVIGVDRWAAALARATLKRQVHELPNLDLVRADGASLPFRAACFDLVVSNLGLNNFDAPAAALVECARVTKPGGRLVLTTNPRGHMRELYGEFRRTLRALGLAPRLERLERNEAHRGTPESLAALVQSAGFRVSRILLAPFGLRYLNGGALLRHSLTRFGFLPGWREVVEPAEERRVFAALEARLDARARRNGVLVMTVPMLYLEARRQRVPPRKGSVKKAPGRSRSRAASKTRG
jgi:ubiquinone/menaquinone biosynthesis C-methylase UbiE